MIILKIYKVENIEKHKYFYIKSNLVIISSINLSIY